MSSLFRLRIDEDVYRKEDYHKCERRAYLITSNKKKFFAKNMYCPKTGNTEYNATWLINEYLCYRIMCGSGVDLPQARVFWFEGQCWWGVEYQNSCLKLDVQTALGLGNDQRLAGILLTDLCLLNNDRTVQNLLFRRTEGITPIDYDKALFGDGDDDFIGRFPDEITMDFADKFVGDYLSRSGLAYPIFKALQGREDFWSWVFFKLNLVHWKIQQSSLKDMIYMAPAQWFVNSKLDEDKIAKAQKFLLKWSAFLRKDYLDPKDGYKRFYDVLERTHKVETA